MKKVLFFVFFIFSVVCDVISKNKIVDYFTNKSRDEFVTIIDGFLNFGYTKNEGVAFGIMTNLSPTVRVTLLTITSLFALFILFYFLFVVYKNNKIGISCLALIFGGAVGNFIDRIRYGAVVDFIDVYYKDYHWPMFNLADSFICIGVFILFLLPVEKKIKCKKED